MFALEELKKFNALPADERRRALREYVECELLIREFEELLGI